MLSRVLKFASLKDKWLLTADIFTPKCRYPTFISVNSLVQLWDLIGFTKLFNIFWIILPFFWGLKYIRQSWFKHFECQNMQQQYRDSNYFYFYIDFDVNCNSSTSYIACLFSYDICNCMMFYVRNHSYNLRSLARGFAPWGLGKLISTYPCFEHMRFRVLERNEETCSRIRSIRRAKGNEVIRVAKIRWLLIDRVGQNRANECRASTRLFLPTYWHRVEYSPEDSEQEYRPEMIEEQAIGHEVAGVQDDRRQHVQEERIGRQRRHVDAARLE